MFQQLKLATGDENIKRRLTRSADVEATTFDSLEIADETTLGLDDEEEEIVSTTEWSPAR